MFPNEKNQKHYFILIFQNLIMETHDFEINTSDFKHTLATI